MHIYNPLALQVISPAPRDAWHEVYSADPEAIPYQSPDWLDCICQTGPYRDASRYYETAHGHRIIIPMVRHRVLPSPLASAASLPHGWGMGGILASANITREVMELVFADLIELPFLRINVRPNPRTNLYWFAARPAKVQALPRLAHVLDLRGGFSEIWSKRLDKTTRRSIRKAERSGVVVECDTTGRLLPIFHALWLTSIERWADQQHEPRWLARWRGLRRDPLRKFQLIFRHMASTCSLWVAWVQRQPAAASLVLQRGNVNDARNVMDKAVAGPTCANDLLLKLAIENACQAGCRFYHLGETGASHSLAHYKQRFGAEAYTYAEYYWERFPIGVVERTTRQVVKRLIGFRDA